MIKGNWLVVLLICMTGFGCGSDSFETGTIECSQPVFSAVNFPQSVASGDPKSDSVILWTRVVDDSRSEDLDVTLTVATDPELNNVVKTIDLQALAKYDHCVKTKITGLSPRTHYYYRFTYGECVSRVCSTIGRTKTAPGPNDNVNVKFAFFSGQDFVGRYYNSFAHLLNKFTGKNNDLDFLVHLGDYIYENDRDPSFQSTGGSRVITFKDTAGAIERKTSEGEIFYSAQSIPNYRTLYKTYRSDAMLQKLHANYPMIVIWDDHEFSDDSWKDVGTYYDGTKNEQNTTRKHNAEQVFFEYMPIDVGLNADNKLEIASSMLYPSSKIYRDFNFGTNLDLIMTDYRNYRPDHLIPEDGFPGTIIMDQTTIESILGAGTGKDPYINIDTAEYAAVKTTLLTIVSGLYAQENLNLSADEAAQKAAVAVQGNLSATYINDKFDKDGKDKPIDDSVLAGLPLGVSYLSMGKANIYDDMGSRYLVNQDLITAYDTWLCKSNPDIDNAHGSVQEDWYKNILDNSTATWKIFGSSVSFTPMIFDFTETTIASLLPDDFPDSYRARLLYSADQWDGFPTKKVELLNYLSTIPGAVLMSGDIHASFATDHGDRSAQLGGGSNRVYEFTGTSVSSGTLMEFLNKAVADLEIPGGETLVAFVSTVFALSTADNPVSKPSQVLYNESNSNGYVVIEAQADQMNTTFYHYPTASVQTDFYNNIEGIEFTTSSFTIKDGIMTLNE